MGTRWWVWVSLVVALAGCQAEPALVASNCDDPAVCGKAEALTIDSVDILLVIDDSASIVGEMAALKAELPRLLNAITTGSGNDSEFPPAKSVHVAVTTTDMGVGQAVPFNCSPEGRDGVFVKPSEFGTSCDVSYPGFLAFEGGPAPIATVETVSCVPLVLRDDLQTASFGCGFEQPLEAALKAIWPGDAPDVEFLRGTGHGTGANGGFLRENSLLVVVVATDEDDCSTGDESIFSPLDTTPVNLRCSNNLDKLQSTKRYVDALKALRPNNDNVVFAVIAGVPVEYTSEDFRANYDLETDEGAATYYDAVLAKPELQEVILQSPGYDPRIGAHLRASCTRMTNDIPLEATPPRRLLEVARGFGARSVLGSLCAQDFGSVTGQLIRTIGRQLTAANK